MELKVKWGSKYEKYIQYEKRLLHGGDYNPDQWLDYPDILKDDLRLMKLANVNTMTVGYLLGVH